MKKSITALITIGFGVSILLLLLFVEDRLNPTYGLNEIVVDDTELSTIISSRELSDTALRTDLIIDDQEVIYDEVDNTFYYSLVEESSDSSSYISTATSLSVKDIFSNYLQIALTEDNELILYNKDFYSISSLVATPLPIMNITVSAETVDELGLDETYSIDEYTSADIYLYDNRAECDERSRVTSSASKIHMRGGTTIGFPQKSYRITLLDDSDDYDKTSKSSLLGMRKDDDWILYSAYSDYEKIRTVFSMNLWADMAAGDNEWNASVSNQYKYVELFFNGRYHGLYALSYPIDNKSFDIAEGESLFKKKDWSGSEFSIDLEYQEYDDGSGGVYFLPGYAVQEGTSDDYATLHDLYYNLAYSGDSSLIRQSSDIDNSIDLWLFYKITQAVDNVYSTKVKNLYTATKLSSTGYDGYKLLFSPWDMDQTWGNRYVEGQGSHGIYSYYNATDYDLPMEWGSVYFLMECGDSDIVSAVKERYKELRQGILSDDNLYELIADYEADIYDSGAFERTMNRWPDGNYYDPSIKLDDFETYVIERMQYMDEYISSL